eukprot:CAMPEP_0184470344 /NCGR_PEP_ID=MMETSP0740-20130409/91866_1 /TAXON_ID=385413 /ORGANISM="Thalassiosira miniscula, Strain CCMP1093" /LENGTH=32 /DNA_ID= /DNA_START= /DNA_END= /DNA_ORIENTATION=
MTIALEIIILGSICEYLDLLQQEGSHMFRHGA